VNSKYVNPSLVNPITSLNINPGYQPADGKNECYAVVVGISIYISSSISNLNYADDDAWAWVAYLAELGYHVDILENGRATLDNISNELEWLLEQEDADDYVVFVFSGHGTTVNGESAIVTTDGYAITASALAEVFSKADSHHIFCFFDACVIGDMKKIAEVKDGVYVVMAADSEHYSYERKTIYYKDEKGEVYSENCEHGVFTFLFLEKELKEHGFKELELAYTFSVDLLDKYGFI